MDINWSNWKKNNYYTLEKRNFLIEIYKKFFKFHKINTKKMNIIEMGAGHGIMTLIFINLFNKILAVDPEENLIKLLNKKIIDDNLSSKINTQIIGCEKFTNKKKFDMVIFTYSFMWIEDKQKCLLNISKVIKKNGYLLVIEAAKFTMFLEKKFIKQRNLMNNTMETLIRSRKFVLIHFTLLYKGVFVYLLQKI
jgi:ubiquinone/menaquinone biosynthesis C-methylase UbiE